MRSVVERPVSSLLAMAVELADSGAFTGATQILKVMESLSFDADSISDPATVTILDKRCARVFCQRFTAAFD